MIYEKRISLSVSQQNCSRIDRFPRITDYQSFCIKEKGKFGQIQANLSSLIIHRSGVIFCQWVQICSLLFDALALIEHICKTFYDTL